MIQKRKSSWASLGGAAAEYTFEAFKRIGVSLSLSAGLMAFGVSAGAPIEAHAATARQLTDCASKVVFVTEYTGCLVVNDWYDGTHVATNWNYTTCSSNAWLGFFCADQHHGHYWSGYANVDWGCVTVMEYVVSGSETYSVHLNVYTQANGNTWYSNWIGFGAC